MEQASEMRPFRYEHVFTMARKDYVAIHSYLGEPSVWGMIGVLGAGLVCLLWSYTFVAGLALMTWGMVRWVVRLELPVGSAVEYRERPYLADCLTYGASESALWVRGPGFETQFTWPQLNTWDERGGWLWFTYGYEPNVYLPIDALRQEGCYEVVLDLAYRYGRRFEWPGPR